MSGERPGTEVQLDLFAAPVRWPRIPKEKVFELTPDERAYIEDLKARELVHWPETLLAEMKCRRMGMDLATFYAQPRYIRQGWLSEESADLPMPDTEYIKHWEPNWEMIEMRVKLEEKHAAAVYARAMEIAQAELGRSNL